MRKVIEEWLKCMSSPYSQTDEAMDIAFRVAADELEAWMAGLWTEITDDPDTWPPKFETVVVDGWGWKMRQSDHPATDVLMGLKLRPIIPGIDTPEANDDQ